MRRALALAGAAALALVVGCTGAVAADRAPDPPQVDCALVRHYVAEHGRAASIAWAVRNGLTWSQIVAAKRCLKK